MIHGRVLVGLFLMGGAPGAHAMQAAAPRGDAGASATTSPPTETATPAPAPEPGAEGEGDEEAIVVTGQRPPGSAIGNIPAEVTLSPGDIRSYGVSTVTDLLAELAAQTGSGQGRAGSEPVTLLNGKRISGPGELRDIPTEAILRVDILPEEVALKYGYRADQKVVNFVLRPRFDAVTGELSGGGATDGGGESGRIQSSLLRIDPAGRLNLSVDYRRQGSVLESERDILPATGQLFDTIGNVGPAAGGTEIDPALSRLVGSAVTVAGVPAGVDARPTLTQFADRAGRPNVTDVGRYRTLRAGSDTLAMNAVLNRTLFGDVSATFNGNVGATGSDGLRGLAGSRLTVPAGNPFSPFGQPVSVYRYPDPDAVLRQTNRGETAHAGFALNKTTTGGWNLAATGNYDRAVSRTRSGTGLDGSMVQAMLDAGSATLNPFGVLPADLYTMRAADRARSVSNSGDVELVASGSPLRLPAGPVSTTVKVGGELNAFDTRSVRSGVERSASLDRSNANAQGNVDIPLTSRRADVLGAIGDLSANVNASVDQLSDFGTLTRVGYGLNWRPTGRLSLIASQTREEGAPTVQQLGDPQISTFDVRVFDYRTGQTVGITQISGGNPDLVADRRRVLKIGANWKPFETPDLSLVANYVRTRIANATEALPAPTAAIEAAFPDRFVRGADGALLSIDTRPVNFLRQNQEQLRWGFNLSVPLKGNNQKLFEALRADRDARIARGETVPERGFGGPGGGPGGGGPGGGPGGGGRRDGAIGTAADRPGTGGRPDGAGGRGFGGGRGGRGGRGGGRAQFAIYHTWQFRNDVTIRDGVPVLDLLDGAASGSGGGSPRHRVEVQAGVFRNGYGARLSGDWQSRTFVRAGGTGAGAGASAGDGDLFFSSLATVDLRLFADFAQIPALVPYRFTRGMRVSFSVTNLFNQRQGVRDTGGLTPIGYQPGYLDPVGREVRLSVRKLFF